MRIYFDGFKLIVLGVMVALLIIIGILWIVVFIYESIKELFKK